MISATRIARRGQTLVEYILVVCLFAVPISLWFFPRLILAIKAIFATLKVNLSGPGI